jgi:hypothetical protein
MPLESLDLRHTIPLQRVLTPKAGYENFAGGTEKAGQGLIVFTLGSVFLNILFGYSL